MTGPQGSVRVCRQGPVVTFQVEGWARMAQSVPLRLCAEHHLADGATSVRVDLGRCGYMDSTFIGTLIFLNRAAGRDPARTVALVAPSEPCARLLRQMGLDRLLTTEAGAETPTEGWTELPVEQDVHALEGTMVVAHQELARLDGHAGEHFRDMVHCLQRELEARKPN